MSGDYSRFSFDPAKRFAAVRMQQGRVQLDSDWNESGDIARERTRLLALDSGGPAWVAWTTTPDAFLIGAIAGPPADLSIGVGRIYVDGRLAEVFAGEGVTYLNQPFLPAPAPFDPAAASIVYLDLWEREVSWAEDTDLLDVALGGVDTTTRVQQVWQVKLAPPPQGGAQCGINLNAMFPPSAGRLTTSAVAPPAPEDPCILPPLAGYRGIENRLYRVEVQVGGPLGAARFKWSRDNGSIVSRVSQIAVGGGQSRVTVNRIGRDEMLRFRINDWVTLTDDHRELNGEAGQMARVVDIDEAARVVVLDRVLPGAGRAFGANAGEIAARNTRLQRWDQRAPLNALDGDGLMTTGAGPIDLEDGVQVGFSTAVAGGVFRVGDHWVFAARTADASVEPLDQEPPRGIAHRYLQLAAIPAGGAPGDCRPPAPRDAGCCTIVVQPGQSIQAAVDALPQSGGCVCLKTGIHAIDEPVVVTGDNVTLHGESMGAIVANSRGSGILNLFGCAHDRIHTLVLRQERGAAAPVIALIETFDCRIDDVRFEVGDDGDATGIFAAQSMGLVVAGCDFRRPAIGILCDKECGDLTVTASSMLLANAGPNMPGTVGILARTTWGRVVVEGCSIDNAVNGIVVDDDPGGKPASTAYRSRIAGNRIVLARARQGGDRAFGIDVAAGGAIVADNHIDHAGGNVTAIRLAGSESAARGNVILSGADTPGVSAAIIVGAEEIAAIETVIVSGNMVKGAQQGIILVNALRCDVSANLMEGRAGFGLFLNQCIDCLVADNSLTDAGAAIMAVGGARNSLRGNRATGGAVGVALMKEESPTIEACRISGAGMGGIGVYDVTGRCNIVANRVVQCGGDNELAVGIGALRVLGELHVEANEVMDIGGSGDTATKTAFGLWGDLILEARVSGNLVTYATATRPVAAEDRALLMRGMIDMQIPFGDAQLHQGYAIQIHGNKFVGPGASALVELLEVQINDRAFVRFERVLFDDNFCHHLIFERRENAATVQLRGRAVSVAGNHVKAQVKSLPSWHLHGRPGPFIGNVSNGPVLGRAVAFPAPESAFNLTL